MNERWLDNYPDVLTAEEAMIILSVGKNTIYNLLKDGELKSIRIGRQYRIPKKSMQAYLDSCLLHEDLYVPAEKGA